MACKSFQIESLDPKFVKLFQKRGRDEAGEGEDPIKVLKGVGEVGKGFVRSVYFLKAPRLMK